jgi:predicted permease
MDLAVAQAMRQLLRGAVRSPGFYAVVVLTLAVGIGANTAIFSVVRGILLRPLPYHEPAQLVALGGSMRGHDRLGSYSVLEYLDVREQAKGLDGTGAWFSGDANLTGADRAERIRVGVVTPGFFELLGTRPAAGRWFAPAEDTPGQDKVVILSHDLWKNRFDGDPALVGKELAINDETHRVVGILPADFRFEEALDLYVPLGFTADQREEAARDRHFLRAVGRMKPGVTLAALDGELAVIGARMRADHPNVYSAESGWRPAARPLLDNLVADVRPSLWLLAAAAGLVLLIVCGNVASLLLARASARQRELSVRAALGATRGRLVGQLLVESLLLSAVGGVLGVLLATWGTDLLLSLAPEGLPRVAEIRLDATVLGFSVIVTAVTGAIFGLIPAWGASRVDLQEALRAASRGASAGRRPRRVRRALVIAETALALVLVTSAALVVRSFEKVMDVDPGFRAEGVLSLRIALSTPGGEHDARNEAWFDEALRRVGSLPGVTRAATINRLPFGDGYSDRLLDLEDAETPPGGERPDAEDRVVSPGYFETMAIPLVAGRLLGREDTAGSEPVVVVSERFAREIYPGKDALGKRFRLSSPRGPWLTVVGIVGDIHEVGLDLPRRPTMYTLTAQRPGLATRALLVRSDAPMAHLAAAVRGELERFDPLQPVYDVRPMTERLAGAVEQRRFVLVLFELFAALALGLAALGLYGVLGSAVAERQREIGVRVALGATRGSVLGLVAREGATLIGVGAALGIVAGLAGTRLLAHLLYDVSPTDPLALLAAIAILAAASVVAMWIPARRALRVDPMEALREE